MTFFFWLTYLENPFLLFFVSIARFSSSFAYSSFAHPVPTKQNIISVFLPGHPGRRCFYYLCICLFPFHVTCSLLLSHGDLLCSLPDFLLLGIASSALRKTLRAYQLSSTHLSPGTISKGVFEELEVCFPNVQGPNFTPFLSHIPQDCELHKYMIPAAQAAPGLDVPH